MTTVAEQNKIKNTVPGIGSYIQTTVARNSR